MQVLFAGSKGREFFSGKGPSSGTAEIPYRSKPTPTLISRQEGQAWNRPFIAVFEPFTGNLNYNTERIELEDDSNSGIFTALKVTNRDETEQLIFQSLDREIYNKKDDWTFQGNFGIIGFSKKALAYLYLGDGMEISYKNYSLKLIDENGSANLVIDGNILKIDCSQETVVSISSANVKKITLITASGQRDLVYSLNEKDVSFMVPAVKDAEIKVAYR